MTQDEIKLFNKGYNEGYMHAIQLMASECINIVNIQNTLLNSDRKQMNAKIKMTAKHILQKRKLIPYEYDIMTSKAEPVELNFKMKI